MKKMPLNMMNAEDRIAQNHRDEKARLASRTRKLRKANLTLSKDMLVNAAKKVVLLWPTNKLAGAVNDLQMAIDVYERTRL